MLYLSYVRRKPKGIGTHFSWLLVLADRLTREWLETATFLTGYRLQISLQSHSALETNTSLEEEGEQFYPETINIT